MNRVVTILLSVLIALVAVNAALAWHAGQQARDDAERQSCIQRTEASAIIAVLLPAVVTSADKSTKDAQIRAMSTLSTRLDDC